MSGELHQIRFELQRDPVHGLDPNDIEGVRGWRVRLAESQIVLTGRMESAAIYVGKEQVERGSLQNLEELGKEAMLALIFRVGGDREHVVRCFREGEVWMELGDSRRRAAGLLELERGTERWWLAWRLFGQGEAGVGVFHGDWQIQEGEGVEALPEPFREWIDTSKVELQESAFQESLQGPAEDIRMGAVGVQGVLPGHPCQVAAVLGQITDQELLAAPVRCIYVFAFRPGVLERFEVRGKLRVPLDDLVRAIAGQGPTEAMAVIHPAVIEVDGVNHRCVATVVERNGRRGTRLVPFRVEGGRLVPMDPVFKDEGEVGEKGMWIGVEPTMHVGLTALGPLGSESMPEG